MKYGYAILVATALGFPTAGAAPDDSRPALREKVMTASTSAQKANAYKQFFLKAGRANLIELMKDQDAGIALQAAWEVHTKAIKRPERIALRATDVYDPDEVKMFVAFLRDRTKAPAPDWWVESIKDVDLFPGQHHAFIGSAEKPGPKLRESAAGYGVPDGAELVERDGQLRYSASGRSVSFPKNMLADEFASGVLGALGEKRSVVAAYFGGGGNGYHIYGFEGQGGKPAWKADVWSAGRTILAGRSYHKVELRQKGDTVYLFGAESHGMYVEAFDVATGKCRFRFCTCYWFNNSERWGLK